MKQNPDIDVKNCKEHSQESVCSSFERIVRGIVANVQEIFMLSALSCSRACMVSPLLPLPGQPL